MASVDERLRQLGIELPRVDRRGQGLIPVRQEGRLLFLSGHGCQLPDGSLIHTGKLGADLTLEQGYEAARHVGVNLLATLKDHLGTLDKVQRLVKVLGFVASSSDFFDQPEVMHGFSDLMTELFGTRGQHARSAIGVPVLPRNQPVEIEMIVRI